MTMFSAKAIQFGLPIQQSVAVTPNDSTELDPGRAIMVGVSGNVKVTYVDGTVDTLPALVAGVWHPVSVKIIWSTGTTATGIHVGY